MIDFVFSLSNPWWNRKFRNLWNSAKQISENKFVEAEVYQRNVIVEFGVFVQLRCDHAGAALTIGVCGYTLALSLYDNRHWDRENNRWKIHK